MQNSMKIYDRANNEYQLVENATLMSIIQGYMEVNDTPCNQNFVGFNHNGEPVVIREGKRIHRSFFSNGNGAWARLVNSTDPAKVAKALKSASNPVIAFKDGEVVCQFIKMTGIKWHDASGKTFFLISKDEREELKEDGLAYITGISEGTYETLKFFAFDGEKDIKVPAYLYNEKNRKFRVGVNFKRSAYKKVQETGEASVAVKNKMVIARRAETGEPIMAHTHNSYEADYKAGDEQWVLEYVNSDSGSWTNSTEEFFKRYEFYAATEDGRAIFAPRDARYVWVHLFGDFIGCIPQWGDAMVAMSNPQINITNPDDVYACSYIEFYGNEDMDGAYVVVKELFIGAPEPVILEFKETLEGYLEATFGIPKSTISASNLSNFLRESLGVPEELDVLQGKIATALA